MTLDSTKVSGNGGSQPTGQETLQTGEGQTSPESALASIDETQSYKGVDVRKLIQDALSADGRAQKDRADLAELTAKTLAEQLTGLTGQVGTLSEQLASFRRARDEAEAESVKDDPEALKSLRTRQQNRLEADVIVQEKARLAAREKAIEANMVEIARGKAEKEARRIASLPEYKVDADKLMALVPDGNPERLKIAAKILKESGVVTSTTTTTQTKPAGLTTRPASIVSAGGSEGSFAKMLERAKNKPK